MRLVCSRSTTSGPPSSGSSTAAISSLSLLCRFTLKKEVVVKRKLINHQVVGHHNSVQHAPSPGRAARLLRLVFIKTALESWFMQIVPSTFFRSSCNAHPSTLLTVHEADEQHFTMTIYYGRTERSTRC
jgi:hypothetical protein